jgi:hypothetical protein
MLKWIWFRLSKDGRHIPVYNRKSYRKARYKRKSERLAPEFWDVYVKGEDYDIPSSTQEKR